MVLRFEDVIAPSSIDEFIRHYWGKTFCRFNGASDRFQHLLSWDALNEILERSRTIKDITVLKDGAPVPSDLYTFNNVVISAPKLTSQLRDGATLLIDGINSRHPPIAEFTRHLTRTLRCHVQVNMYAAWGISNGFEAHWDDHDVLILQIHGVKRWEIFGETPNRFPIRSILPTEKLAAGSKAIWADHLRPGDALYIPRGWWHFVVPCAEPVVHLTVGLHPPNGVGLLDWVRKELKKQEVARIHTPVLADKETQRVYSDALRKSINDVVGAPDFVERYLNDLDDSASSSPLFGLPDSAAAGIVPQSDDYRIVLATYGNLEPRPSTDPDCVDICFEGTVYTFDSSTAPLFAALNSEKDLTAAKFYDQWEREFDRSELKDFLLELTKRGMIVFARQQELSF